MQFFKELQRRNVFRVTIGYVVSCWLLAQVADLVLDAIGAPAWVMQAILLILVLGFPVVVFFSWAYEVTPEGIKRESEVDRSQSTTQVTARKLDRAITFVLLIALAYFAFDKFVLEPPPPEAVSLETFQPIRSIAVLPLDNYSADPGQEYFAEGMTDELTAELASISRLKVISRGSATQFKGDQRPSSPEIAELLNVDAIIEGSVRREGDRVRITAQLIDAREDRHLWAKTFDRKSSDVLALQGALATEIAHEIDVQLTPDEAVRLTSAPSVVPEAYDAYLRGRFFFNRPNDENLSKAIIQFEQAIEIDPTFAPAYSGLSDAYLWAGYNESIYTATEGREKARIAAEQAVALKPDSAEAITSLAVFKCFYEYDWAGSEALFRKAITLNDNYAYAHDQFALLLTFMGRYDESIAQSQRAAELDPLSPQVFIDAIFAPALQGNYADSRQQVARAEYLDPTYFFVPWGLGWIDLQQGKVAEAVPYFETAKSMEAPNFVLGWLGYAYGASGDRENAQKMIDELKDKSLNGYVSPFNLAIVHLGMGDTEKALSYLEQARAMDTQWVGWMQRDWIFDPLRAEPRFQTLLVPGF